MPFSPLQGARRRNNPVFPENPEYMRGDVEAFSFPGELQGKTPDVGSGWGIPQVVTVVNYSRFT